MPNLKRLFYAFIWVACLPLMAPAQQSPAQNPAVCAKCHVQARTQPFTQMARALQLPDSNPLLKTHPKMTFAKAGYSYLVETHDNKITYTVTDGVRTLSLPIEWSFGVGNQTWVFQREGKLYESMVSYYPAIDGLEITTGDEKIAPHTLEEAAGRVQSDSDVKVCFGCHTSNSIVNGKVNLSALHPGVNCERCHQGSDIHYADIVKGKEDTIPADLSKLSSEDMSTFCGNCHRAWETVIRNHSKGEFNVRFQPYRLANSRCFDGTDPRISCIACHDPHQSLNKDQAYYDSKCLACHSTAAHTTLAAGPAPAPLAAKVCPVSKSGCVSCHMPKVTFLGGGLLKFTDHQIRIVKPGEPYPN